jgi:putative peptidoglycan binding protein
MPRPGGPAYGSRVLELGTDGLDTWELQIKLIGWGSGSDNDGIGAMMDPVVVNGSFTSTTGDAVKRFQKAHGLRITGVVDGPVFQAIDHELSDHVVSVASLRCPCASGQNNGVIPCRCPSHPGSGKCGGFGKKGFAGKYLYEDDPTLPAEPLPVYAKDEHDGVDKAAIWAARALMHRAGLDRIKITAGYRCWHDNYFATDESRWHHRRGVLHLGSSIEFIHPGKCVESGNKACPECERVRAVALARCGYQLRWHRLDRVTVGEGGFDASPPTTPFALHLDTVMLKSREKADFVKTDEGAAAPLYAGKAGYSLPMDLGQGRDPMAASITAFYDNVEQAKGGLFPIGTGRMWHGGVHLHPGKKPVHAMTGGEVVACRVGEAEGAKALGSRNFVLLKHAWKGKTLYCLYLHLDGEKAAAKARVGWRKVLYLKTRDHAELLLPGAIYRVKSGKLEAQEDLGVGARVETTGAEIDPRTLDTAAPTGSKVIKLEGGKTARYVYTKREGTDVARVNKADAALADKLAKGEVIGLEKTIVVAAGEAVGSAGKAAKDAALHGLGAFVHLEAFADSWLFTAPGYLSIDASAAAKIADRRAIAAELVAAKLLPAPPDGVLLDQEIKALVADPGRGRLRSVVVKMESAWSVDWKDAFAKSPTFGFMKDADRDALGDAFNAYRWWGDAKAGAKAGMPGAAVVFHYHPIVLLLQMAYSP